VNEINKSNNLLSEFPITGQAVCNALSAALEDSEYCVIIDVETLCSSNCKELGNLWHKVSSTDEETLRVTDLLVILKNAHQVIRLDLHSQKVPQKGLFIEDGVLVENTLYL